jgi:hypothetical protein
MFEYVYLFPIAILIAVLANSSGFSGGVIFQPVFYFFLQVPLPMSIATGIATETLGMMSGAFRYFKMKLIDFKQYQSLVPWIILGNLMGIFLFKTLSLDALRITLGLVLIFVSLLQLTLIVRKKGLAQLGPWKQGSPIIAAFSGTSSALTGTGQAELMQPLLMLVKKIDVRKANATAIALEATGNLMISIFNLKTGNINFSILIWTGLGVIIGGQLGALKSVLVPTVWLRLVFSILVLGIGAFYIYRSFPQIS